MAMHGVAEETRYDCTVLTMSACQLSSTPARQTSSIATGHDMDEALWEALLSMIERERAERQKELFDLRQELKSLASSSTNVLRTEFQKEIEDLRKKTTWIGQEHSFAMKSSCEEARKAITTMLSETQEAAQKEPKQESPRLAQIYARKRVQSAKAPARTSARATTPTVNLTSQCASFTLPLSPSTRHALATGIANGGSTAQMSESCSSQQTLSFTGRWSHEEALTWFGNLLDEVLKTKLEHRASVLQQSWKANKHHIDTELHEPLKDLFFQKLEIRL